MASTIITGSMVFNVYIYMDSTMERVPQTEWNLGKKVIWEVRNILKMTLKENVNCRPAALPQVNKKKLLYRPKG